MAKVPPPSRKGEPPLPEETVGNLDNGEHLEHIGVRVKSSFKREFKIFGIQHGYESQADIIYEAFELLKEKKRQDTQG